MVNKNSRPHGIFGKVSVKVRLVNKPPKEVEKQMDGTDPLKTWKPELVTGGVTEHAPPQPTYTKLIPLPERVTMEVDQPKKENE